MTIVPYGALPGFSLQADVREVAAHYGVRAKQLRTDDGRRGYIVGLARHALFWKLTQQRRIAPARVAALLSCSEKAVREGAAKHEARRAEFVATNHLAGADT